MKPVQTTDDLTTKRKWRMMGMHMRSMLVLAVAAVITVLWQLYFLRDTTDDAYILFRFVDRFTRGLGLTFNNGERVEGYSSPLWTLLLAGERMVVPLPIPVLARISGLLLLGITFASVLLLSRRLRIRSTAQYALLFGVMVLTPGLQYYAGAGLETPLLMTLVVLGAAAAANKSDMLAATAFGLASVTRPEGILYTMAWILWGMREKRMTWRLLVPALGFAVAWEIFRVSYYHAWLPNTAIAKSWQGVTDLGVRYLARFLVPVAVGAVAMWLLKIGAIAKEPLARLIYLLMLAGLAFVVYAQGDWMFFGRFVIPIVPLLALVISMSLDSRESGRDTDKSALSKTDIRSWVVTLLVLLAQIAVWYLPVRRYVENEGFAMLMRGRDQLDAAEWIHQHYPAGSTLATGRLGALSYGLPDFTIWDFGGLTDREEALHLKNHTPNDPVLVRRPLLIAEANVPESWSYTHDTLYLNELRSQYRLIRSFPQGHFGTLDLWERISR